MLYALLALLALLLIILFGTHLKKMFLKGVPERDTSPLNISKRRSAPPLSTIEHQPPKEELPPVITIEYAEDDIRPIKAAEIDYWKYRFSNITYATYPEDYKPPAPDEHENKKLDLFSKKLIDSTLNINLDQKLTAVLNSDNANTKEISQLISADPILSAKVLRMANSAYFNFSQEITSVGRAAIMLGFNHLKTLIMQHMMTGLTPNTTTHQKEQLSNLWIHSSIVSNCASYINMNLLGNMSMDIATSGLLHDIGKYFLILMDKDYQMKAAEPDIITEERKYGINHAQLGSQITRNWQLPKEIQAAIYYHNYPTFAAPDTIPESIRLNAAILNLANIISHVFGYSESAIDIYPMNDSYYYEIIGIPNDLSKIITPKLLAEVEKGILLLDSIK